MVLSLSVIVRMTICPKRVVGKCGTFSMGVYFFVAHRGATGICGLKTVGLSAVCDRRRLEAHPNLAQVALDLEMDGEESVFYRQLPKVVSSEYGGEETRLL